MTNEQKQIIFALSDKVFSSVIDTLVECAQQINEVNFVERQDVLDTILANKHLEQQVEHDFNENVRIDFESLQTVTANTLREFRKLSYSMQYITLCEHFNQNVFN